jgi:hypothetical protein
VAGERYTAWTFGELPELLEIRKGGQTLIGFPALVDAGDAVQIEVFDEPDVAAARHRSGLRRLFALQLRDALKYLEKNIPDLQKMGAAYMPLGTLEELRAQIVDVALDRAFLLDPLPADAAAFQRRVEEGRGRLTLIASEVARLAAVILADYALAQRKIRDNRQAVEAVADVQQQLQRLMPRQLPDRDALGASCSTCRATSRRSRCGSTSSAPTRHATPPAGRAAPAGDALLAPAGRTQGRHGCPHAGVPLAAGGAAGEFLRAGAAHAAAGQHQAAGQGMAADQQLT